MWDNFRIALLPREPSADELLEAIRAEAMLAEMDFHEDLAELAESDTDAATRRDFAETYRKLIGVHPTQRTTFREGLERVRDGGGMPIADLIDVLRRRYASSVHSEK